MKKIVTLLATVSAVAFLAACSEQKEKPMTMPRPLRQVQSPKQLSVKRRPTLLCSLWMEKQSNFLTTKARKFI